MISLSLSLSHLVVDHTQDLILPGTALCGAREDVHGVTSSVENTIGERTKGRRREKNREKNPSPEVGPKNGIL